MVIMAITLIILIYSQPDEDSQSGGSRAPIFSRFNYQPDFPFISQFDMVDLDRFSKVYNVTGPVKFLSGRPYKYYATPESTWLYPWQFPQEINHKCINKAGQKCHESVIMVKTEEDKLGGLGIATPRDIVRVSPCFDQIYKKCQ